MRRIAALLLASACAGTAAFTAAPSAAPQDRKPQSQPVIQETRTPKPPEWLYKLRKALSKFDDPRVAERFGYRRTDVCAQYPYTGENGERIGGMGYHYVNERLVEDPELDPYRPEALVYVPYNGGRRLGAVEYIKRDRDQRIATADDRPKLFGREFQGPIEPRENGMPIHYEMHLWLFLNNPRGLFEPWNPRVFCPPTNTTS
ncbi:hypothetical protein HNP84_000501 [Thermocatellispora tengchongensis]|uniref:Uncharacterized protein n=1 Tax=Thermocatellispora tengchongensis TaxID=1073253 RepID=A0A840NYN6_9ACTN|nr:hypothetical protein [Thermocatellispora tengchongensis]MBB5130813.1 hypothetical protein [Thermocatellispora tengchongensis]